MGYFLFLCLLSISLFADEKTSSRTIQMETELLSYTATVGSLPIFDDEGTKKGEIGFISYVKEGPATDRPITFAFNGGPGSSSVWLHMGTFGPRRFVTPEEGQSIVPPYLIVDNLETILDLTDLVFIDPVGTGFSEVKPKADAKAYFDVTKDIHSIGHFVRDFLLTHNRWNCPKYLAGESYGSFRAAGLANYLQSEYGIYLNGILLISSALDFQTVVFQRDNLLPYSLYLPTFATTAWYHGKGNQTLTLEQVAAEARKFVYENYIPFLLGGASFSSHQKDAIYDQLATWTGLPKQVILRWKGRISDDLFFLELFGTEGKVVGRFDSRLLGDYIDPHQISYTQDPSATTVDGIFSAGFHEYLQNELLASGYYRIFSSDVHSAWNFSSPPYGGYPNMTSSLREAMVVNPDLQIFFACGYFDCATPFATVEYCLNHLNLPDNYGNKIETQYYEGGHMFYLNPTARVKFKQHLTRFYERTIQSSYLSARYQSGQRRN